MLRKNIIEFLTSLLLYNLHSQNIPEKALVLDRTTCITFEEVKNCPIELPASCNIGVTKLKE